MAKQPRQLPFRFADPRRPRRGRPPLSEEERKKRGSLVRRVARPEIEASNPLHVTLRVKKDVRSLRRKVCFLRLREAIELGANQFGMRVVHFAVMNDHIHLIVEAHDKKSLSLGMQGLNIRMARAINRRERSGKVFRDRYHAVVLDSPRQVRNVLAYVLLNARRHAAQRGRLGPATMIDPCTSGYWFDGWSIDVTRLRRASSSVMEFPDKPPTAHARTWLLNVGWRVRHSIHPSEVPGS